MQSKALVFGFVAAASAQSSSVSSDASLATVVVGPATTSTVSPAPSVTVDPAVINSTVDPSSSAVSYIYYNTTFTSTVVVSELVTVCGAPTTYKFNGAEYPATEGETITITNCPCTLTTAVPTLTSEICPGPTGGVPAPGPPAIPPVDNNVPGAPAGTPVPAPVPAPGAASASTYVAPSSPTAPVVEVSGASSGARMGVAGTALAGLLGLLAL
ncbi:hypothetical protein AB5N19_11015 [Seiridium cardinale]|uniref:Uncharacterized protein n=1 Tax=Seiridium cardinale TaxID=138064 RepID=A0ABR2X8V3_9PEZI